MSDKVFLILQMFGKCSANVQQIFSKCFLKNLKTKILSLVPSRQSPQAPCEQLSCCHQRRYPQTYKENFRFRPNLEPGQMGVCLTGFCGIQQKLARLGMFIVYSRATPGFLGKLQVSKANNKHGSASWWSQCVSCSDV